MSSSTHPEVASPVRELMRRHSLHWAERVAQGAGSAAADAPPEALFVDAYAGSDYPRPAGGAPLCVAVARRVLPAGATVLLLEEDPAKVEWLGRALADAGIEPGALLTLLEDSAASVADLATAAAGARSALLLLDLPTARGLSLAALHPWLAVPGLELLVRFPAADLRRLARQWTGTLADLTPYARRLAEGVSGLLGDARGEWVYAWRSVLESEGEAAATARMVGVFAERLEAAAGRRACRLEVGEEHLLLLSHDPWRPLALHEVLFEARCEGWLPWPEEGPELVRYVAGATLPLFGADAGAPGAVRQRVVDRTRVAHTLGERFAGRTVRVSEVLDSLHGTELFAEDVRRALAELRRDGRALYRSLSTADAEIAFPRFGARLRGVGRGRRGRGGGEELDLL